MNFKILSIVSVLIMVSVIQNLYSQDTDSIEVYLIDAYSTREIPYTFKLSFYTSDLCKSKVLIEDEYEYDISAKPVDLHKISIDLSDLSFNEQIVNFVIICEDSLGNISQSELFDFDLPFEPQIKEGSSIVTLCLFGAEVFLLPYPNYVNDGEKGYISLTKEIPLLTFRSRKLNYPAGYLSLEYTYIFDAPQKNYLRAGYKQIYSVPYIEYVSPGISFYTNFLGNNGVSPEVSLGWFTILDSFTFYTRYRYNLKPGDGSGNFQEVSIGLYSSYFSFYLD